MDTSKKPTLGPSEEWFDGIIKAVAVWGTALAFAELTNRLLIGVVLRSWRVGLSLLAAGLVVATIFWGGGKWPRLREIFFAWRYPLAFILALYVGYQWNAYDYARSKEARLSDAMRWACAKSELCRNAAVERLAGQAPD